MTPNPERTAIVAWLRDRAVDDAPKQMTRNIFAAAFWAMFNRKKFWQEIARFWAAVHFADAIEAGDHLKDKP